MDLLFFLRFENDIWIRRIRCVGCYWIIVAWLFIGVKVGVVVFLNHSEEASGVS